MRIHLLTSLTEKKGRFTKTAAVSILILFAFAFLLVLLPSAHVPPVYATSGPIVEVQNTGFSTGSSTVTCLLAGPWSANDILFVMTYTTQLESGTVTDTLSNTWAAQDSQASSGSYAGKLNVYTTKSSSGESVGSTDTISVPLAANSVNTAICQAVAGLPSSTKVSSSASGSNYYPSPGTATVGSITPTANSFALILTGNTPCSYSGSIGTTTGFSNPLLEGWSSSSTSCGGTYYWAQGEQEQYALSWGGGSTTGSTAVTSAQTCSSTYKCGWAEAVEYYAVNTATEKVTITPANSYSSSDTATIGGGCNPQVESPSGDTGVVPMNGVQQTFIVYANCPITFTVTISGTAGYSFASNSTSWGYTTTTNGGTDTKTQTVYRMYYNTLEVTAKAAAVFDTGLTFSFTCAYSDTSSGTCVLPHTGTSTAVATMSYKYWTNYNQGITAPATASGAASGIQWENAAGTTSTAGTPTSGGNTYNTNYYKQGSMSVSYTNSGGTGSCTTPTFYYTSLNSAQTYAMTGTPTAKWIDWGTSPYTDNPQPGSTSTERCGASTTSYSVSASGTIAPVFYLQWEYQLSSASVPAASLPAMPYITSTVFGSAYNVQVIGLGTDFWLDSGASWSVTNPVNSGSQRWDTSQIVSGTVSSISPTTAGNGYGWTYYEQEYSTFCAEPVNPVTFDGIISIAVSGKQFGSSVTLGTISTNNGGAAVCVSAWSDYSYAATVSSTVADGSNKRISATTTTTGAINSSGNTYVFAYFLQIQLTFNLVPLVPSTFDSSRTIKVTGPVLGLKTVLWTYTSTNGDGKQSQAVWLDDNNFLDCESSTGGTSGTWISNMTETGVLSTPGGSTGVTCGYTLIQSTTTTTTTSTTSTTSETTTLSTYSTTTTTTPGTTTSTTETQTSWSPTTETTTTTTSTSVSPSTTTSTTTQTSWSPTTETTTTTTSTSLTSTDTQTTSTTTIESTSTETSLTTYTTTINGTATTVTVAVGGGEAPNFDWFPFGVIGVMAIVVFLAAERKRIRL